MTTPALRLSGPTVLERALSRAATHIGRPLLTKRDSSAAVTLSAEREIELPDDEQVPWAIVDHAVTVLIDSCTPVPSRVDVVALVPAGRVCGPAHTGPVDAVRDMGMRVRGTDPVVATSAFAVQHTRCWVLCCALARCVQLDDGPQVRRLPDTVCGDTARICQYMHDLGFADDWPGLTVSTVDRAGDNVLHVTAVCTDALWVSELLGRVL